MKSSSNRFSLLSKTKSDSNTPVSYTHLDVYKRQLAYFQELCLKIENKHFSQKNIFEVIKNFNMITKLNKNINKLDIEVTCKLTTIPKLVYYYLTFSVFYSSVLNENWKTVYANTTTWCNSNF